MVAPLAAKLDSISMEKVPRRTHPWYYLEPGVARTRDDPRFAEEPHRHSMGTHERRPW